MRNFWGGYVQRKLDAQKNAGKMTKQRTGAKEMSQENIERAITEIVNVYCNSQAPLAGTQRKMRQPIELLLAEERARLLASSPCGRKGHIANDWYSVCSAHRFYEDGCGNCKCGGCFRCEEVQAERQQVTRLDEGEGEHCR